jgi:hypothetical protein
MKEQSLPNNKLRRWSRWLTVMRITVTLHLAAILVQAALAGLFLAGSDSAVNAHEMNGIWIARLCLLQLLIAILLWRLGGASIRPFLFTLALFMAEVLQIFAGFRRILPLHVPLAMLIFGGLVSMTITMWRFPETIARVRQ